MANIKLVIGNGFDMFCKLQSSYNDYFMSDSYKNDIFLDWIKKFKNNAIDFLDDKNEKRMEKWIKFEKFEYANIWDFFFYLRSNVYDDDQKKWRWCDIESEIFSSLCNVDKNDVYNNRFKWDMVLHTISSGFAVFDKIYEVNILSSVILMKRDFKKFSNESDFYYFLLDELKKFEKNFGKYIAEKRHLNEDGNKIKSFFANGFQINSEKTIHQLIGNDRLVSIDSFNYDDVDIIEYNKILHNINGNIRNPIFGIDSTLCDVDNPKFIFTKTNRRLELDMIEDRHFVDAKFEEIVVFGHSLNKSDYNYFFPLFDKIGIADFSSTTKIIFGFAIYNPKEEYEIRKNLRLGIQEIFEAYAKYKGFKDYNRMLDSLTTQGRVITREINNKGYIETV